MFSTRNARPLAILIAATLFATQASAQSHEHPAATEPPSAEAQKAFTALKSIAGGYQGYVTEPTNKINVLTDVALRVTSMGNVIVHELKATEDNNDNPLKGQHPVTMMYMDGPSLMLTHYCDSGNRPRMTGRVLSRREGDRLRLRRRRRTAHVRSHATCAVHHHRPDPSYRGVDVGRSERQHGHRAFRPEESVGLCDHLREVRPADDRRGR
jgi:hypothetical protein